MPLKRPKLRWPLEVQLEQLIDKQVLLLRCPLGISPEPLGLVPIVAPLLHHFDGEHSIEDIVTKYQNQGATVELVQQLIDLLDQHYFLESPRFDKQNETVRDSFRNSSLREAALAGGGYSRSRELLERDLDEYLFCGSQLEIPLRGGMVGLVAPHIDYQRGGKSYGITYSSLREEQHDLYILLGTAHQYSKHLFHLTAKDFDSPLGPLRCDREFVKKLAELYGEKRSYADEFLHKREHSLELQVPFLKRMREEASMVPILVGGFHQMLHDQKTPSQYEEYETFAAALSDLLKERVAKQQSVCFVAGVDMAHVGQTFGDRNRLTPEFMEEIEIRDKEYLQCIESQDKDSLFSHIAEDQDARRICGFPTMYTVLDVCSRAGIQYTAQIFDYHQAVNYETDCAVTFAGLGMYYSP